MKFPECTVVSINLPNELLAVIDSLAAQRIVNRSACVRELVSEALKLSSHPNPFIPQCKDPVGIPAD